MAYWDGGLPGNINFLSTNTDRPSISTRRFWLSELEMKSSDRVNITLDNQYRPHSFDRQPSVVYPDGRTEYHWRGVRVPEKVITAPEKITHAEIGEQANTEVRRVMLEKFGLARYLKASKATLVDEDEFGKLWSVPVPDDEALTMVEVLNSTPEEDGTFKTYFLRVPPQMKTPCEAVAWTFSLEAKDYDPVFQS